MDNLKRTHNELDSDDERNVLGTATKHTNRIDNELEVAIQHIPKPNVDDERLLHAADLASDAQLNAVGFGLNLDENFGSSEPDYVQKSIESLANHETNAVVDQPTEPNEIQNDDNLGQYFEIVVDVVEEVAPPQNAPPQEQEPETSGNQQTARVPKRKNRCFRHDYTVITEGMPFRKLTECNCVNCNFRCETYDEFKNHYDTDHPTVNLPKMVECNHCDAEAVRQDKFYKHAAKCPVLKN